MEGTQPVQGRLDTGCTHPGPHTGVLFVHGIGQQQPGETLRDWGAPIVRAISDVRLERGLQADPVVSARLHPEDGRGLYIELEALGAPSTPHLHGPQPPAHWVLTEAWWADRVTAPSFAVMAAWLGPGGVLARIGETVLRYSAGSGPSAPLVTFLRRIGLRVFLVAVASLLLFLYGILRVVAGLIPIGPFRDGLLTRAIDNFMLEWFGDVYVLIADRAQSAEIRRRFEAAAWALRDAGCERIVVVAHSGGAIVSLMAMAGEPPNLPPVDRWITHGEGLNLAWRILGEDPAAPDRYRRLYRRPWHSMPGLIWNDFWATQDPAPSGPLDLPPPVGDGPEQPYSTTVWNRASIRSDHGSYWANDEEFVVPLIRLVDGRLPRGGDSQFHRSRRARLTAIERRRDRVALLALARQFTISGPAITLILALVADGGATLRSVGAAVAGWFGTIPVLDAVARAVSAVRGALAPAAGSTAVDLMTTVGMFALGLVLAGATLVVSMAAGHQVRDARRRAVAAAVAIAKLLLAAAGIAAVLLLAESALRRVLDPAGATPWTRDDVARAFALATAILATAGLLLTWLGRRVEPPLRAALAAIERAFADAWERLLVLGGPVRRTMFWRVVRNVTLLIVGVAAVLAPLATIVLRPDVGELLIGGALVLAAAAGVGRLAAWRWGAWDERERAEARREHPRRLGRWHVLWQAVLLLAALLTSTAGIAFDLPGLLAGAIVLVLAIALVGVSIDVVSAEDSSGGPGGRARGGRVRNMLKLVQAQRT